VKPSVYVETTVVSYLTARPSRDPLIANHQAITRKWWSAVLPSLDPFISQFVLTEILRGDAVASRERIAKVADFSVLQLSPEIRRLAQDYFVATGIPSKAEADAYHLAMASWHGMDYLVSWNLKHIVSARVRKIIEQLNERLGIRTPIICTPEELMEV
jgi:predicted nucleic acid-binding protein